MSQDAVENRWTLSAPESLVLLWGRGTGDVYAVELGLLELVARGFLDLRERKRPFPLNKLLDISGNLIHIRPSERTGCTSLDTLLDAVPLSHVPSNRRAGYPVQSMADTVLRRQIEYVPRRNTSRGVRAVLTGRGYVWSAVLPDLVRRGYYTDAPHTRVGAPESWRRDLTPAGEQALVTVRQLHLEGQGPFASWVTTDPPRAWDYLERAGSSLFLIRGLLPHLRRLASSDPARAAAMAAASRHAGKDANGLYLAPVFPLSVLLQTWFGGDLDQAFNVIGRDVESAWESLRRDARERGPGE